MKKNDAEKLYFFVNDKNTLDAFNHLIDLRISVVKDNLTSAKDIDEVRRLQGAFEELRRMKHIRDEVNNPKD